MDALRVILAWTAFAVFHSLTVSEAYENLARRWMGDRAFDGYHRLFFTAYSIAVFLLLVLYLRTVPDRSLYRLEGFGRFLFHAVQLYGVVRHPLYLGISVVLVFPPVQTRNSLLSTAMVVLYFYVGTFFEERRMVRKFGEEYRKYREHVPRFLPLPRPNP